jgi:hypothetical protein
MYELVFVATIPMLSACKSRSGFMRCLQEMHKMKSWRGHIYLKSQQSANSKSGWTIEESEFDYIQEQGIVLFSKEFRLALESAQSPMQRVPRLISTGGKAAGE